MSTKTIVERRGAVLLEGLFISIIDNRYATTTYDLDAKPTELVDLVSGERVALHARCDAVGVVSAGIVAVCVPHPLSSPSTLELVGPGRRSRVLAYLPPSVVPQSASVSPDGRWVLVSLAPGCGLGWAAVAPTAGGAARLVTGGGLLSARRASSPLVRRPAPPFSSGLGWTAENRLVATVWHAEPSGCSGVPAHGTFVIDPATLAARRSTSSTSALLWGPA